MPITELPPFTPRLEEFRAEEFLAHTLTLLEYAIEQDQNALDIAPFQVKAPPIPPEPPIGILPHIWYPKPTAGVLHFVPKLLEAQRPIGFVGQAAQEAAERAMRPLLGGVGPITIRGEAGIGKTTLLRHIATHERTRQRFRRIWYFDAPERVGQLGAIVLGLSNTLAQDDLFRQFSLLSNELDDDTLLVIDNLSENHPLLLACQTLSPFTLLGVESAPEIIDEEDEEPIPDDPPGVVTLRRLGMADAVQVLAHTAELTDRKGIPRELAPVLQEITELLGSHPMALVVIGTLIHEDGVPIEDMLSYLQKAVERAEPGPQLGLDVSISALPSEIEAMLVSFGAFSPMGVPSIALENVLDFKNELAFQRALTFLKRRRLIEEDTRAIDNFVAGKLIYRRAAAEDPHDPGKHLGERVREWILQYAAEFAYDPAALCEIEPQLRHAYQIVERHRLHDFATRLSPTISDYLRTYIPPLLPKNAPPPRLTGERAQALQLARHGLEIAETGEPAQGRELLISAIEALKKHGSDHELSEAMVMLARLDSNLGDHATAITTLEEAAKLLFDLNAEESLSIVRLGLATAYRHHGRLRDALGVLDDRPESDAERARIYRAMGDLPAMTRALGKTGDMTPYAKAESYLQAHAYGEALEAISEDHSPQSHLLRALIYHIQEDYEGALLGYEQALSTYAADDPERAVPARSMASIYALQADYDTAEEVLTRTLEELKSAAVPDVSQIARTQVLMAAVHLRSGANRTAVETATQALEKLEGSDNHRDLADAYRTLGRASWRLERHKEALQAFLKETEHAQSEDQRDETRVGIAFFHAGEAYRATEEPNRAVANLRRALSHIVDEQEPYIYFIIQSALHRVLLEAERFDDALEVNEAAIDHLDAHPPPDLQFLGQMLAFNIREYQRREQHQKAYKGFSRWLSTLSGRADALTDPHRPQLAVLALSLAARSLMALGRAGDALPLAEEATNLADEHFKEEAWQPARWAARRDYGEALITQGAWQAAHDAFFPLLNSPVQSEAHTYALAQEGTGYALHQLGTFRKALDHYWTAQDYQPNPHRQGLILERVADSYLALGETSRAVENLNEAIKLIDRQNFPGDAARALTTLAHTLAGVNRYADAIGVYEDALEMLRAVPDASPLYSAQVFTSLGRSNEIQGQLRDAAKAYRNALDTLEKHHVNAPDDYRGILLQLGRVLAALENYDDAIPYFEKARDQANDWGTTQEVGNITRELAEAERDGGYLARSLQTYEDGLELLTNEYPEDRAAILRSYGQALAQGQQFEQARHAWNEALTMAEGLSPLEIALTHHAIGQAFKAQNDHEHAASAFREALEHHPKGTVEAAETYRDLGETLLNASEADDARQPLQTALEVEKALPQQSNARLVKTLELLGGAEEMRGDYPRAITHYHAALVYMDRAFQPQRYAGMLRKLGQLYAHREQWEDCQKALGESLDIEFTIQPRDEERIAATLRMSADAYLKEGHLEKAASAYKRMASHANLSDEDAGKLRTTLNDIDRHKATLNAALDSLMVMEKAGSEPKDFAFVYALIVRMYYLLSEIEQSRKMMGKLVKYLNERAEQFSVDDERADYRSLAHLRLAMLSEQQSDIARARDHYRMALKDNTDSAIAWLIEQSMEAVG